MLYAIQANENWKLLYHGQKTQALDLLAMASARPHFLSFGYDGLQ